MKTSSQHDISVQNISIRVTIDIDIYQYSTHTMEPCLAVLAGCGPVSREVSPLKTQGKKAKASSFGSIWVPHILAMRMSIKYEPRGNQVFAILVL